MRRRLLATSSGAATVFAALMTLASCGAKRTPEPPMVQQPTSALVEVPYPPPPARVELLPAPPAEDAVWVDGEWVWQGGRWAWRRGRWVVVPPGVAFAPWTAVRSSNGTLHVAEGTFRDAQGNAIAEPETLARGRPRGGSMVNPEGEPVPQSAPAASSPIDGGESASPAGGAFVDVNLPPMPKAPSSFPDASTSLLDASMPPFRARDAASFEDAMPVRPLR